MTANASARAPLPSLSRCRRPSRASRAKSASKNFTQYRDGSSGLRQIEQMTALGILYLDDPGIGIEVDLALAPRLHGLLLHQLRHGGHEGPGGGLRVGIVSLWRGPEQCLGAVEQLELDEHGTGFFRATDFL